MKEVGQFGYRSSNQQFNLKNFSLPLFNTDNSNLLKYLKVPDDSAIQRKIDPTIKRNIPRTGK